MSKLTQNQLRNITTTIRNISSIFLIDTCTLESHTGDLIVNGESKPQYALGKDLSCRFITKSGNESKNVAAQGRLTSQSTFTGLYKLQVPLDAVITVKDRIRYQGRLFLITYIPVDHALAGSKVIEIEEIQ